MRAVSFSIGFALVACSGTSHGGGAQRQAASASASGRGIGTMHVALTAPTTTAFDVPNATCLTAARGEAGGGLHVSSAAAGVPQSASIDDGRVGADGADDWTASASASMLDAPLEIHIAMADGAIFSGGAGSETKLASSAGGTTGSVVFSGATYAGKSGVADAAGTITWSCTTS